MYNDDMNNMMMPNDNNYTDGSSGYNDGFGTNNDNSNNNNNNYYGNEEFDVFGNSEPEKRSFNKKLLLIPVALVVIVIIIILLMTSSNNKYTVKTKTISMKVKETEAIKIEAKDKVKKKITCSSKDSSIASVNSNCVVTGESVGNTIIYVGVNGKKTNKVTVRVDTNKEELALKEDNITVKKDETQKLELTTVLEEDVFTWTSNNEDVATVDENGVVTGVHGGTATIVVRESDGRSVSARVTVESDEILIENITIPDKVIAISEKVTLKPTVIPEKALKILKWESSKETVATVDENGVVTGIGEGEATITVTTHNNKKATAKITVDGSLPSSIKITNCTGGISIGTPLDLGTELEPSDAKSTITWSSSNNSIATVSGGKVNAKNTGKVTITATTKNGKKATCKLTASAMGVNAISVSPSSVSLDQGATRKISVTFNPSNAKNYYKVSWSTANSKIATVNSSGEVKGVNPGTTTITAKAGGRSAKVTVTVNASSVTSVKMSGCVKTAEVNQTMSLSATASPSSAKNKTITWKTSDSKVATVSGGKVSFKDVGTVTITASTANGKKATCKVTVKIPSITKLTASSSNVKVKKGSSTTIRITTNLNLTQFKRYYGHLNYKVANTGYIKVNSKTSDNPLEIQITGLVAGSTTLTLGVGNKTVKITVTVTA